MRGPGGCGVCKVISLLVGLGALNWGLYAFFDLDLVARLLGVMTMPAKIVYGLIGLAGLGTLVSFIKQCPCCCKDGKCGCDDKK